MKTYIIAEAGVNHNGDLTLAKQLILEAKNAGADCVKFQTFISEEITTKDVSLAKYQKENSEAFHGQFDLIKSLELPFEAFKNLQEYASRLNIDFLSTPDDFYSLNFLIDELKMQTIKIGSGEITNLPFLKVIGGKKVDVILSTGMSNIHEVEKAYNLLIDEGARSVSLLQCTTSYPCPMSDVNLKVIETFKKKFKCSVGFSDHTLGIHAAISSIALGAEILEKHLTLDCSLPGPDHKASLDPNSFKNMVDAIRDVETAMGDGIKKLVPSEMQNIAIVRRKIVSNGTLNAGTILNNENIKAKRSNIGIDVADINNVIGKKLLIPKSNDDPICQHDLCQ